jgi:AmmeMemoRadiSam system protein B
MSLVYAALVPHPPLLLPSIGREHAKLLDKTAGAFEQIKRGLAGSEPETMLVISPHLTMLPGTFTVNHAPQLHTHFREFGDFSPARKFRTDSQLVESIRHSAREAGIKINTVSDAHLDYGSGVPLSLLTSENQNLAVVTVSPTLESAKNQFALGQVLKEAVMNLPQRIAVICSGDLSHRLSSDTPDGFSPKGKEFTDLMIANLSAGSASPILQMNDAMVEEAHACGYQAICLFLGVLDKVNFRPEALSYEAPFGVGYLTMQFSL